MSRDLVSVLSRDGIRTHVHEFSNNSVRFGRYWVLMLFVRFGFGSNPISDLETFRHLFWTFGDLGLGMHLISISNKI